MEETTTAGAAGKGIGLGWEEIGGFDLDCDLRIVWGVANTDEGLRRVGGAILTLLDQTLEVGFEGFSSSVEEGGGKSPYNPPSIVNSIKF